MVHLRVLLWGHVDRVSVVHANKRRIAPTAATAVSTPGPALDGVVRSWSEGPLPWPCRPRAPRLLGNALCQPLHLPYGGGRNLLMAASSTEGLSVRTCRPQSGNGCGAELGRGSVQRECGCFHRPILPRDILSALTGLKHG